MTRRADIDVFDQLPPPVRAELRACRAAVSSKGVARLLASGVTVAAAIEIVREVDRRMVDDAEWNLAFWGV